MAGSDDENPPPPPPQQTPTQQAPHTVSTIKLPININGVIKVLPPKPAKEILARERERKARTTLLMALPEDHLAKFHKMTDANEMWDAIKSRFGGNDESKKMQKYILKQQFEGFSLSNSKGLHKGYDRFQSLLSQLKIHGAGVSIEDANQKFLSGPHLDHEDLEQLDEFDLEEISKGNTRYKAEDNGRRPGKQEEPKALVTLDGEGVDWISHAEDEQENFALMAYSNSGSDTKVTSCSKECVESYAKLKKLYDEQREQLDDKTDVLTYHKKLLAEAVKEKEELKTKLENFQSSSKGLSKLLNSQMSTRDKSGLGYGNQVHNGVLSYENEVFQSVFDSRSSDVKDSPVHDKFANVEGMHAVPPPMTRNYMPSGPDREVDDSMFTYGPKQSKTSESDTQTSNFDSCKSNSIVETLEFVPEPVVVEPKIVSQPEVWSDALIIEEYESDNDDEYVIQPSKEQERPSSAFYCDFHEKRMAKHVELNKKKGKGTGQEDNRPVWNNVQRLNHQNKFVPKAVLTKTSIFPVNTARQNLSSQAVSTSAARKVNVVRPIVNDVRSKTIFHKTHTPIRRPFNRTTAPRTKFSNQKVNTDVVKAVSVVGGIKETVVMPSAGCNWRPKRHYWNKVSKYNSGSSFSKNDDPHKTLKNKGIVYSGCSKHMTRNKAYLDEYQGYNGGPVAFGGSKGYITGKGKIKTGKLDFEDVCFVKEL
ncbi:hypothetical protein Tco_0929200 [Tanacetum coccineum]